MKFDKLVQLRYSVRRFDQRPVEKRKVQQILKAAVAAPSAKNRQSWRCLVLDNRMALAKLPDCTPCHYHAPLAFIVGYDKNEVYHRECDGESSGVIDASIAATHIMLEACELGVGSTWVMNFDPVRMREIYHIPEYIVPVALLVCGFPREDSVISPRHNERKPIEELCRFNDYQAADNAAKEERGEAS
jgi:nitroreductase